jgi:stage V sporulation protein B
MAGLFFRALVGLDGDMVKAIDRPRIEFYSAFAGVVVDIGLNAVLIPRFGLVGAAFGTVVGYVIYNVVEVAAIYRSVGSYPFSAAALKPLVPTTIVGLGILSLTAERTFGLFALVGIGIALYAAQFASMVLTRSFTDADLFLVEQFENRIGIDLTWLTKLIQSES